MTFTLQIQTTSTDSLKDIKVEIARLLSDVRARMWEEGLSPFGSPSGEITGVILSGCGLVVGEWRIFP